jgi:hypothetical protein
MSPPSTTPRRSVTTVDDRLRPVDNRLRHVTPAENAQTPRHRRQQPQTPRHCRQTVAPPLLEGCGRRNQRVGSEVERGGWEREPGGKGRGDKDAGKATEEGGGCSSPLLPCLLYQKPTRRRENHALPRLCSIIPPGIWGGLSTCSVDNGVAGYPPAAPFRALLTV